MYPPFGVRLMVEVYLADQLVLRRNLFSHADIAADVLHGFGASDTPIVADLRSRRCALGARGSRALCSQAVGNAPSADGRISRLDHIRAAVPGRNRGAALGNRAAAVADIRAQ